ncbi:MAG: argininosuccinate lyase, partial [Proteobacteria bacterium]|nr:argininosuccinate lyase [Pseudomonadota bacterium]
MNLKEDSLDSKLWGARFKQKSAAILEAFNASIGFDYKLYEEDIQASLAHVKMLAVQNIIPAADAKSIEA